MRRLFKASSCLFYGKDLSWDFGQVREQSKVRSSISRHFSCFDLGPGAFTFSLLDVVNRQMCLRELLLLTEMAPSKSDEVYSIGRHLEEMQNAGDGISDLLGRRHNPSQRCHKISRRRRLYGPSHYLEFSIHDGVKRSLLEGYLRKFSDIGAWYAIEDCAQYDKKCSNPTSAISDETIANPNAQIVRDDMVWVQVPSLGTERGLKPPIKPQSPDSFRMKVLDDLTIHIPPSSLVASFHLRDLYCYYRPCIDDPKKRYGFKPGLLGHRGYLGVDFSKLEMIEDDLKLESKEVSFLERGLNSPVRPKEVEKVRIKETRHLEHIIQQPIF
ncbi:hypothetical protein Tco_1121417 [Tanacetum coccineum]|uniref:Uncharacterized protein n=1 Tax=Tanacetum coccineum TaxID=301880 RepID=A0ABQ5IXP6_9ASTR